MTQTLDHTPDHEEPTEPAPAAMGPWFRQRRWQIFAAGTLVLALAGTIVGVTSHQRAVAAEKERVAAAAAAAERDRLMVLTRAVATCNLNYTNGVAIADQGRTVTVQTMGADMLARLAISGNTTNSNYADVDDLGCVLREAGTPTAIVADMAATRALDGRQRAEWDDISAAWSYHPDDGFNLVMTIA